jgi:hypothetical protein
VSIPIPGGGYIPDVGMEIVFKAMELDAQSPKKARTKDELNPPPGVAGWDRLIDDGYLKEVDGRPGMFYLVSPFGGAHRDLVNIPLSEVAPIFKNWRFGVLLLLFVGYVVYMFTH